MEPPPGELDAEDSLTQSIAYRERLARFNEEMQLRDDGRSEVGGSAFGGPDFQPNFIRLDREVAYDPDREFPLISVEVDIPVGGSHVGGSKGRGKGKASVAGRGKGRGAGRGADSRSGLGGEASVDAAPGRSRDAGLGGGRGATYGSGRGVGGKSVPHQSSSAARRLANQRTAYKTPRSSIAGNAEEFGEDASGNSDDLDKADWSSDNIRILLEIMIEEASAGNRPNGTMTTRACNNVILKYKERTGLRHNKMQFKNRLKLLRDLCGFWLDLNKDTGLGWDEELGTVTASDKYWKDHTKGQSDWKKLQYRPPDHKELLVQVFAATVVDGSNSCMPGENGGHNAEATAGYGLNGPAEENIAEGNAYDFSPQSSKSSLPMNKATTSTVTSPKKIGKNPMVKVMNRIHTTLETNCAIANKVMQGELRRDSIHEVMDLVVECGAEEGSAEHFMASQLFVEAKHRDMFSTLKTKEGRFNWLKRWCMKEGIN